MTGRAELAHHLAGQRAGTLVVPARSVSRELAYFSGIPMSRMIVLAVIWAVLERMVAS